MSDILDKLNNLEHNLNLLNKKIDSTNLENTLLKNQQTKLVSEKSMNLHIIGMMSVFVNQMVHVVV